MGSPSQLFTLIVVDPLSYGDGVVTIRRLRASDIDADLAAKDEEQIRWLWEPGQRETWDAMTLEEQRSHALRTLQQTHDAFGPGPKWCFGVDTAAVAYVAYVDCDLANPHVPLGDANISYSAHPASRGLGYVSRAVRLILRFLLDLTAAPRAHILVDAENIASLRVARSVGASVVDERRNDAGRSMVRHVIQLPRGPSSTGNLGT